MEEHPKILKIPPLTGGVIHLWMLSLNRSSQESEHYFSLLSDDEKVRAEKFYFPTARNHFIAGRGLLRTLLGKYLAIEPGCIEFQYEKHGKPKLRENQASQPIQFNLSHSEEWGIVALCLDLRIGVDIEMIRPMADMDDLATRFFTDRESALIESLSGDEKQESFYKIWTCKEAYLKGSGEGLLLPLDQVEVWTEADGSTRLLSKDGREMTEWQLHTFNPQPGYQCAICVEGGDMELVFQSFDQ
jgi:4'-phosphopantetheinyl transferase